MPCSSDRTMLHSKLCRLCLVISLYNQWGSVQRWLLEKVKCAALTGRNKGSKTTFSQHVGQGIRYEK